MIVRLYDKEKMKVIRRSLIADIVYVVSIDAMKEARRNNQTQLTPVELFLTAQQFVATLCNLPDIDEGIDDELEDLEDETETPNEAMIIGAIAVAQIQALGMSNHHIDAQRVITHIINRWVDHDFLFNLLRLMDKKEQQRWMDGKKTELVDYEMQQISLDGGGSEEVREFMQDMIDKARKEGMKSYKDFSRFLVGYNESHHHAFDKELREIVGLIGPDGDVNVCGDYVNNKHVENEVANVESGAIGVKTT